MQSINSGIAIEISKNLTRKKDYLNFVNSSSYVRRLMITTNQLWDRYYFYMLDNITEYRNNRNYFKELVQFCIGYYDNESLDDISSAVYTKIHNNYSYSFKKKNNEYCIPIEDMKACYTPDDPYDHPMNNGCNINTRKIPKYIYKDYKFKEEELRENYYGLTNENIYYVKTSDFVFPLRRKYEREKKYRDEMIDSMKLRIKNLNKYYPFLSRSNYLKDYIRTRLLLEFHEIIEILKTEPTYDHHDLTLNKLIPNLSEELKPISKLIEK